MVNSPAWVKCGGGSEAPGTVREMFFDALHCVTPIQTDGVAILPVDVPGEITNAMKGRNTARVAAMRREWAKRQTHLLARRLEHKCFKHRANARVCIINAL